VTRAICRFCARVNPEGARFCNECGSPLTLVGCPRCEAINALDADRCHQCGEALPGRAHAAPPKIRSPQPNVNATISASGAPAAAQSVDELDVDPLATTPIALARRFGRALNERATDSPGRASDAPREESLPRDEASAVRERQASHVERIVANVQPRVSDADREPAPADLRPSEGRGASRQRFSVAPVVAVILLVAAGAVAYYVMPRAPQPDIGTTTTPAAPVTASPGGKDAQPRSARDDAPTAQAPRSPAQAPQNEAPAVPEVVPATPSRAGEAEPGPSPATPAPAAHAGRQAQSASGAAPQHAAPARPANRSPRPAPRQLDKDALATQRLIERDLAPFRPPQAPDAQR
jgi:hypothetical protein